MKRTAELLRRAATIINAAGCQMMAPNQRNERDDMLTFADVLNEEANRMRGPSLGVMRAALLRETVAHGGYFTDGLSADDVAGFASDMAVAALAIIAKDGAE